MARRLKLPQPTNPYGQPTGVDTDTTELPAWLDPAKRFQPEPEALGDDYGGGIGIGNLAIQSPPMSPEEESSLLGNTLSAVGYIGSTLDKPGAAVRGLLGGAMGGTGEQAGVSALKNLIPFSDTLGITNPEQRVSGRDLLEQSGIANANEPGLFNNPADFAGDVGGFAAEVVTDPLFWMTGPLGTLTKSGQAALKGAEKVGTASKDFGKAAAQLASKEPLVGQVMASTPAGIAEQFRSGLRSPVGLHVPFTDINAALPVPQAVNDLMAGAIDKITYGKLSPFPMLRGALSHTAGGVYKGAVQREKDLRWVEKEAMKGRIADAAPAFRARADELEATYKAIADHHKVIDPAGWQAFERDMLDTANALPDANGILEKLKTHWDLPADASIEGISAEVADIGNKFHEFFDTLHTTVQQAGERYKALGGDLTLLNDKYADYFPRRLSPALRQMIDVQQAKKGEGGLTDIMQFWRARKDYLRNYPGRSAGLNRIATDPAFMGTKEVDGAIAKMTKEEQVQAIQAAAKEAKITLDPKLSRAEMRKQYVLERYVKPDLNSALADGRITKEAFDSELQRFTDANHIDNLKAAGKGATKGKDATDNLIHGFSRLPKDVVATGIFDRRAIDDWHSYMKAVAETESTLRTAHSMLAQPSVVSVAGKGDSLAKAWKDAGFKQEGLHTFLKENTGDGKLFSPKDYDPKNAADFIKGLTIDPQAAKTLGVFSVLARPDKLHEAGGLIDKINATYKGWLTVPFPAFHARNRVTGFWQNVSNGTLNPIELLKAEHDAMRYAKGDTSKMQFLQEFLDGGGLSGHGMEVDIAGSAASNAVPGGFSDIFSPIVDFVKKPKLSSLNPLNTRGGFGKLRTDTSGQNLLMEMGDKAYNWVEFLNRAAPYEAMRRKGMTPAQAMYNVNRAQFVYGQLAPLEKTYLRRAIPFYNWMRRSIPYTLQRLLENPGGPVGQAFRLESQPAAKDTYTPAFLKEGMNIPWGGGTPQATTFLRQAGLPIEDLNRFVFKGGALDAERTAEKFGAQLHPLLQLPIELSSGKQLFTGRKIDNLESVTERLTGKKVSAIDKAIHYSPLSRVVGESMSLGDPRKTWLQSLLNATTGFKSGTYDIEKQKAIDLRNAQEEIVKDAIAKDGSLVREGTNYYVPLDKRNLPGSKEAVMTVKKLNRLRASAAKLYKQREEAKKAKENP